VPAACAPLVHHLWSPSAPSPTPLPIPLPRRHRPGPPLGRGRTTSGSLSPKWEVALAARDWAGRFNAAAAPGTAYRSIAGRGLPFRDPSGAAGPGTRASHRLGDVRGSSAERPREPPYTRPGTVHAPSQPQAPSRRRYSSSQPASTAFHNRRLELGRPGVPPAGRPAPRSQTAAVRAPALDRRRRQAGDHGGGRAGLAGAEITSPPRTAFGRAGGRGFA